MNPLTPAHVAELMDRWEALVKGRDARIRELEASLRVAVEDEEDRARQVAEGDERIRELEAEVERLKKYLNEVGAGGGRESGRETSPPETPAETSSLEAVPRTRPSAAYPAARRKAGR